MLTSVNLTEELIKLGINKMFSRSDGIGVLTTLIKRVPTGARSRSDPRATTRPRELLPSSRGHHSEALFCLSTRNGAMKRKLSLLLVMLFELH